MAISKMNTALAKHHRWIFGVFTVIIIITFVGFLSPGEASFLEGFTGSGAVGKAFGHRITHTDMTEQLRYDALLSRLTGRGVNNDEQAMMNAFSTLAMGYAAQERGVTISDYELAQVLRSLPFFVNPETGKFDKAQYQKFLDAIPVNAGDFEEALRRMLLVEKLQNSLRFNATVTDDEVRNYYNYLNEVFDVQLERFNSADYLAGIVPSESDLSEYFKVNRDDFRIPSQMTAEYVAFSVNDPAIAAKAKAAATPEAIKAFFDANANAFAKMGEDGTLTVPDFAAVQSEVTNRYILLKSRELARAQAGDFIKAVLAGFQSSDKQGVFERAAKEQGLTVVPTGDFSAKGLKIDGQNETNLLRALSTVTEAIPMTPMVEGKDRVFVGFLLSRTPERDAEYNEVAGAVLSAYRKEKALEAAQSAAEAKAAEYAAMSATELAAAVAAAQPAFTALPTATRREMQMPMDAAMMALGGTLTDLAAGTASAAARTFDGAVIAYVVKRTPADAAGFDAVKASLTNELLSTKVQINAMDFMDYVNANCEYNLPTGN